MKDKNVWRVFKVQGQFVSPSPIVSDKTILYFALALLSWFSDTASRLICLNIWEDCVATTASSRTGNWNFFEDFFFSILSFLVWPLAVGLEDFVVGFSTMMPVNTLQLKRKWVSKDAAMRGSVGEEAGEVWSLPGSGRRTINGNSASLRGNHRYWVVVTKWKVPLCSGKREVHTTPVATK